MTRSASRPLRVAELLSVGSELTAGETRDTNSGELARELTSSGVRIRRIQALPDELGLVQAAFAGALEAGDLVISTGGLGPTPDDLTREAIAAALGETPSIDPQLEAWLRQLWARRNMPFATINLKQAWLIPSATAIPNPNGTAPGWWVDAAGGRVIVAMPGPPREMEPMWHGWVLPRLRERGIGANTEVRVLRTTGIGESQLAELLGEPLLRSANPIVATYARSDGVDIRISAIGGVIDNGPARSAAELADSVERLVLDLVDRYVWARGETTWAQALDERLAALGWTLATAEIGTHGALAALFAEMRAEVLAESHSRHGASSDRGAGGGSGAGGGRNAGGGSDTGVGGGSRTGGAGGSSTVTASVTGSVPDETIDDALPALARSVRSRAAADVALALRVTARGDDSAVEVAIVTPAGEHLERRLAFLRGTMGRHRAAITAASLLLATLPSASRSR